jgi:ubiquinone/menaquinone biosynthesis C-methylase UbiE
MKWMLDSPHSHEMSARTRKTIGYLDLRDGMNILDAGCGPGRLTIPLAKNAGSSGTVTAMDLQEGMLNTVRDRAVKENIENIHYIQGGIGEGKLETDFYDRVALITVLGEIPDRESALREIFGALKPGGILLIEETIRDPHFQTQGTVRSLAQSQGFTENGFFGNRFSYTMLLQKPLLS